MSTGTRPFGCAMCLLLIFYRSSGSFNIFVDVSIEDQLIFKSSCHRGYSFLNLKNLGEKVPVQLEECVFHYVFDKISNEGKS